MALPEELEQEWSTRGLYGAVKHNVKAIYQRYLGWYDGNPSHLDPLPPEASARKWLEYAGGREAVLRRAQADYDKGEYRWVAEVLGKLVQADPGNRQGAALLAAAFEQLGYQAESATWRNAYLQGAQELRQGLSQSRNGLLGFDLFSALDAGNLFDALAVRLNSQRATGKRITINWHFTDLKRDHLLTLERSTLNHLPGYRSETADVSVRLSQATLRALLLRQTDFLQASSAGLLEFDGQPLKLLEFFGLFDEVDANFPIVSPRPPLRADKRPPITP
jgi:alkyl sulfatase BDS1-like metallo-beta-lactamase superfamily hydrolase